MFLWQQCLISANVPERNSVHSFCCFTLEREDFHHAICSVLSLRREQTLQEFSAEHQWKVNAKTEIKMRNLCLVWPF